MKTFSPILPFLFILMFSGNLNGQTCKDVSVELRATVQESPPAITLLWTPNAASTQYTVYRKLKTANAWGIAVTSLSGSATQYVDNNVTTGISYEYKITRNTYTYTAYGYINTGINIPLVEDRGKLILLIDSNHATTLAPELERLVMDLEGDGWSVVRHIVAPSASVASVKALIVADYNLDPLNTKSVFLFGHIPVPYSGNIAPDGHGDHVGAWPADVYYGDIDGNWTDYTVNNSNASGTRNDNIPGDGKFDQNIIPGDIELQVGRVDLSNMPAFSLTESQLLKNYLDKDHDYRHKVFNPIHRAVIDDNFGYFGGEAFAASAWRSFGPLTGSANVIAADYFTTLSGSSYLWSYGCGGGSYTSAGGIGNTANFAASDLQGVFTILFGSYFGDWDSQNNFLRAPLAQGKTLTDVWSGRPHWVFHHMGLGENIGYDVRISQNNNSLYPTGYSRYIHLALMGDPSLRNDIVAPVSNVIASKSGNFCHISWTASTDTITGYHVYVKSDSLPAYTRINTAIITGTSYTDSCQWHPGIYTYMVRPVKLQISPSGTYYNAGQGIGDTAFNPAYPFVSAAFNWSIQSNNIVFNNTSGNATSYHWDFGDGSTSNEQNPTHTFAPGNYVIQLIALNGCTSDTISANLAGPEWNTITGIITYANAISSPMGNTIVHLKDSLGTIIATDTTNAAGQYAFQHIPDGNYRLFPQSVASWGGANGTDAMLVLKHYTNNGLLSGIYLKAADVNASNYINSLDAMMIARRFVGALTSFPGGNWYFENPVLAVSGSTSFTQNIKGLCYGDCNGSFLPAP